MLRTIQSRLSGKKKKKKRSSDQSKSGATSRRAKRQKDKGLSAEEDATQDSRQQVSEAKSSLKHKHSTRQRSESFTLGSSQSEPRLFHDLSASFDAQSVTGRLGQLLDPSHHNAKDKRRLSYPGMQTSHKLHAAKSTPSLHRDANLAGSTRSVPASTSWQGGIGTKSSASLSESANMEQTSSHSYLARVPPRHSSSSQELNNRQNSHMTVPQHGQYPYQYQESEHQGKGSIRDFADQYWNRGGEPPSGNVSVNHPAESSYHDQRDTDNPRGSMRQRRSMWEQRAAASSQGQLHSLPVHPSTSSDNLNFSSSSQIPTGAVNRRRSARYAPQNSSYSGAHSMQDIPGGRTYQHFHFSSVDNGAMARSNQSFNTDHEMRSPSFTDHNTRSPNYTDHNTRSPNYTDHNTRSPSFTDHNTRSPSFTDHNTRSPSFTSSASSPQLALSSYSLPSGPQPSPSYSQTSLSTYSPGASTEGTSFNTTSSSSQQHNNVTNLANYPRVVRNQPTPHYNTSTQTEVGVGVGVGPESPLLSPITTEEKCVQARPESLINNTFQKSQLDTALSAHRTSANWQDNPANQLSPRGQSQVKENPSTRVASIVDKMEQKQRIPETIREVSHEDRDRAGQAEDMRINEEVNSKIHEYTPSETDMLRKLSQEFYSRSNQNLNRSRAKVPPALSNSSNSLHVTNSAAQREQFKNRPGLWVGEGRHDKSDSGFCSREASQDQGAMQENAHSPGGHSEEDDTLGSEMPSIGPFERRSKAQMSMRKAYGIFDETESMGDKRANLLNPGNRVPVTQVQNVAATNSKAQKTAAPVEGKVHKKRSLFEKFKGHSKQDSLGEHEKIQDDVPGDSQQQSGRRSKKGGSSHLRRTTSEQLRPIKEKEKRSKKHRNSDPKDVDKTHKGSDPTSYQPPTSEAPNSDAMADFNITSTRNQSESDNVFHEPGALRRQKKMQGRSASSSSVEDRHSTSSDLRRHQQNSAEHGGFLDRKTGKRVSTSSLDSSMSASERSLVNHRLSSSDHSQRSPSPPPQTNTPKTRKSKAMKKSVSLPRDVMPPYSADGADAKMQTTDETPKRRVSSSGRDPSPTQQSWGAGRRKSSSSSQLADKENRPAKPPRIQETEVQPTEEFSPNQTSQKTFDYGSSVLSQDDKTARGDGNQRTSSSTYQVTVNSTFGDSSPPSLPPRNYRTSADSTTTTTTTTADIQRAYPERASINVKVTSDFDSTPRADLYADQLRASARRISQSQRLLSARYLAKPVPEAKTSISVSRPVEKPPSVQEAKSPNAAIYRCTEYSRGLNFVGLPQDNGNISVQTNVQSTWSSNEHTDRERSMRSSLGGGGAGSGLGSPGPRSPNTSHEVDPDHRHANLQNSPIGSDEGVGALNTPLRGNTDAAPSPRVKPPPPPPHIMPRARDTRMESRPLPPTPPADLGPQQEQDMRRYSSPSSPPLSPPLSSPVYASDSYMNNRRSNIRQGFGGSYRSASSSSSSEASTGRDVHVDSPTALNVNIPVVPSPTSPDRNSGTYNNSGPDSFLPTTTTLPSSNYEFSSLSDNPNNTSAISGPYSEPLVNSVSSTGRVVRVINVSSVNKTGAAETRPQPDISMAQGTKASIEAPPWGRKKLRTPPQPAPFSRTYPQSFPEQTSPKPPRSYNQQYSPSQVEQPPRSESPSVKMVIASLESGDAPSPPPPPVSEKPSVSQGRSKVALMKENLLRQSSEEIHRTSPEMERRRTEVTVSPRENFTARPVTVITPNSLNEQKSPQYYARPQHAEPSVIPVKHSPRENSASFSSSSNFTTHQFENSQNHVQNSDAVSPESGYHQRRADYSMDTPMSQYHTHHSETRVQKEEKKRSSPSPERLASPENSLAANSVIEQPQLSPGGATYQHVRQKSQEELVCEQQAAKVAQHLPEDDSELSAVILPPPDHKTTNDYMSGIFDTNVDVTRRPSLLLQNGEVRPIVMRRESIRQQQQQQGLNNSSDGVSGSGIPQPDSAYWSPPSMASMHIKMREEGFPTETVLADGANTSLDLQKTELIKSIEKKLSILSEEDAMLKQEIDDNNQLGKQLTAIVQQKVNNKTKFNRYKLYVDELDKVMYLLLKLSGRLARAENAIMSLPEDASQNEKDVLICKRDELSDKHQDAKELKEGIDRRSQQVAAVLKDNLSREEFADYEYFIKMKSKLTMDQQEIDDKIKLGEDQLQALKESMANQAAS